MKKLFWNLVFLSATAFSLAFGDMNRADASGSNTVFLSVRSDAYAFTSAMRDPVFLNSKLFNYFESAQRNTMLVGRVSPYIYRTTYYYTYYGYNMDLGFADYGTVTFKYYPALQAIVGVTENEELVILMPQLPSRPEINSPYFRPD